MPRPVFDTDDDRPPGGVGEGCDGAQEPGRRRQIALELNGLALWLGEQGEEIHDSEVYSEVLGRALASEYGARRVA